MKKLFVVFLFASSLCAQVQIGKNVKLGGAGSGTGTVSTVSGGTANGLTVSVSSPSTTPNVTVGPDGTHVIPVNTGSSSNCLREDGTYGPCGSGGGLSGQTTNCVPKANSATTSTSSAPICDDGTTTTITHPVAINSSGASQTSYVYNATPVVPGSSTTAVVGANSSGKLVVSAAGGSVSPVCDVAGLNGVCGGGTTTNPLTMNNSGSGASSGSTFDGSAAKTISYNTIGAQQALTLTTTGSSGAATLSTGTLNIPVYAGGSSSSNPSTCTASNGTNVCLNLSPYYASPDGAITTTTTGTFGVGTSGTVGSCSTFSANQGIDIVGAGTAGADYIGTVSSCSGTTLTVTPTTVTSVSGAVVKHDETHAFQQALTDCDAGTTHSCTIYVQPLAANGSTAYYRVNGPPQNTGTANAMIQLPSVANYGSQEDVIAIKAFNEPSQSNAGMGPLIRTDQTGTVNLFGAYDGATGGGYPPLTAVNFSMENLVLESPTNSGVCLVNMSNAYSFQQAHMLYRTDAATVPTNPNGCGFIEPLILNNIENQADDITVAGFATNAQLTEHTHIAHMNSSSSIKGVVIDTGANAAAPSTYKGNSVSIDYLWSGASTCGISGGSNDTGVNILNFDSELSTTDICDPSNHLRGHIGFLNPYSPHTLNASGAANLSIFDLWGNSYITPLWIGTAANPLPSTATPLSIYASSGGTAPAIGVVDTYAIPVSGVGIFGGFGAPNMNANSGEKFVFGHDGAILNNSGRLTYWYEGSGSASNYWWMGLHNPSGSPPSGICGNGNAQIGVGFGEASGCSTAATLDVVGTMRSSVTGTSPSTSPICPNGTGGTFTTSGCTAAAYAQVTSLISGSGGANSAGLTALGTGGTGAGANFLSIAGSQTALTDNTYYNGTNWVTQADQPIGAFRFVAGATPAQGVFQVSLGGHIGAGANFTTMDTTAVTQLCANFTGPYNGCWFNPQTVSPSFPTNSVLVANPSANWYVDTSGNQTLNNLTINGTCNLCTGYPNVTSLVAGSGLVTGLKILPTTGSPLPSYLFGLGAQNGFGLNTYYNGSNWIYSSTGVAGAFRLQGQGTHTALEIGLFESGTSGGTTAMDAHNTAYWAQSSTTNDQVQTWLNSGVANPSFPSNAALVANPSANWYVDFSGNQRQASGTVMNWNGDTGLSRDSAGVVDVGNGTAGDKSGTLNLSNINSTAGQFTIGTPSSSTATVLLDNSVSGEDATGAITWIFTNSTGHLNFRPPASGGTPAVSSCGGGSIATGSVDNSFSVTGITTATACTVTFAHTMQQGFCTANSSVAATPIAITSASTSAVTFGMSALTGTIYAHCF